MEITEDIGEKVIEELKELNQKIEEVMAKKREYEREFPRPPPNKFREKRIVRYICF